MKKNIMRKNLQQSILKSITRYIAIVAIIALGSAIFVGLRTTKADMIVTGQKYMDSQNMFDLRLLNTYGWSLDQVEEIRKLEGVEEAEGIITMDVLACRNDGTEESVYKLYAVPQSINQVYLLGGRMPEAPGECLADGAHASDDILGTTFTVSDNNSEDILDSLTEHTFTVVGYVSTPLYMDLSRGTTTLGSGTVSTYIYAHPDTFDVDYFSEVNITIGGDHTIYSDAFNAGMDAAAEALETALMPLAQARYERVRSDAEEAYRDGLQEYEDGLREYEEARADALGQLEEARDQLIDGQAELDENLKTLLENEEKLKEGQEELDKNSLTLANSRKKLALAKAEAYSQLAQANAELLENYKLVSQSIRQVEEGLSQISDGLNQLDSGISQLESGLEQLDLMIGLIQTLSDVLDTSVDAAQATLDAAKENGADVATIEQLEQNLQTLREKHDEYASQLSDMKAQKSQYAAQLEELKQQREDLTVQKGELQSTKAELEAAMVTINDGFLELQNSQTQADNEFAAAEAQLESGEIQMDSAQKEIDDGLEQIEEGKKTLAEAQQDIDKGWEEYRSGREEALEELSQAQLELAQAQVELKEAKETIDGFEDPSVFVLTRNTNVGYLSLNSNSDIVKGVSTVFPAFFLLIAAMVCITTMTRMVEEERTQIGTLKALGYSDGEIISKYLVYAGSAAVLGCGFGVLAGSVVFPVILWEAYGILLNIMPNIVLTVDWWLCIPVVLAYTAITLLVTWYCCRRTLQEVPAELIRPKAPTSGKKIFLEYLPFWNKISFLNKVMLRNIFRYRQRLLMMLLGIGGCTALLLTGFGVRDSIVDLVHLQFDRITCYDIEVRFSDGMKADEQKAFQAEIGRYVDDVCFFSQSSVEMDFEGKTQEITLMCADQKLAEFIDFHINDSSIAMPGTGEVLLSIGVAEKMGIRTGDTVVLRNTDMKTLTLTVSGIYENYVNNYCIVDPNTLAEQWGETPEQQMACVKVADHQDVHEASARIAEYAGVMNVTVCEDTADQVSAMLQAMDLIVVTIVICAGMLAVTVLYNLTNINITERIREIATIKVLGFNAKESALYVFKENILLSVMGCALGLVGGYALLCFVISQIKVDIVWFDPRLTPLSYLLSVVLTMLSAIFVDIILYFKLDKINMAEALKSVE
ncbi:MAG: hypothetical protein IJO56_06725 [Oscillospiraceae bacterium]|nr:hypothetical protein [Oscillospiraceae bacterium]